MLETGQLVTIEASQAATETNHADAHFCTDAYCDEYCDFGRKVTECKTGMLCDQGLEAMRKNETED